MWKLPPGRKARGFLLRLIACIQGNHMVSNTLFIDLPLRMGCGKREGIAGPSGGGGTVTVREHQIDEGHRHGTKVGLRHRVAVAHDHIEERGFGKGNLGGYEVLICAGTHIGEIRNFTVAA